MTALVLVEFDVSGIKQPSRSAVAAAEKLGEVPATLGLVLAADRVDRPYAATFVLDHRGFAPELLAAASCLLLRLCAPERQSAIVASQR